MTILQTQVYQLWGGDYQYVKYIQNSWTQYINTWLKVPLCKQVNVILNISKRFSTLL